MRPRALLACILAAAAVAGCGDAGVADPVPDPVLDALTVPTPAAPGAYAFQHAGGPLSLATAGTADLDVFDAADRRVGGFALGDNASGSRSVELGLAAGELVLQVRTLDGALLVASGGAEVRAFRPLAEAAERRILAEGSSFQVPAPFPLLQPDPQPVDVNVTFARPSTSLRLLVLGHADRVQGVLAGGAGPVLRVDAGLGGFPPSLPGIGLPGLGETAFRELPGEFLADNVRDGHLAGTLNATGLDGMLVLESFGYSRARLQAEVPAGPAASLPPFRYGTVAAAPSAFEVPAGATALTFFLDDPRPNATRVPEAWATLFGPGDERLALVHVRGPQAVSVPVARAGSYVVAPLHGALVVGTDRLGDDFELHPLEVATVVLEAGGGPSIANATVEPEGVPFALAPRAAQDPGDPLAVLPCEGDPFLRLDVAGEAVAVRPGAGRPEPDLVLASALLGSEGLTFTAQADGSGCSGPGLRLLGYLRPLQP